MNIDAFVNITSRKRKRRIGDIRRLRFRLVNDLFPIAYPLDNSAIADRIVIRWWINVYAVGNPDDGEHLA